MTNVHIAILINIFAGKMYLRPLTLMPTLKIPQARTLSKLSKVENKGKFEVTHTKKKITIQNFAENSKKSAIKENEEFTGL